jgi:hypothetical protein
VLIRATDNFKVARVAVSIFNPLGILIEQGEAVADENNFGEWVYYTKQKNVEKKGSQITAEATDLPGNTGLLSILL